MIGTIDAPADGSTVSVAGLYFAGWGFEPVSGLGTDRVELWTIDPNTGVGVPLHSGQSLACYLPRPDVQAAYGGTTSRDTGFHLYIGNPPPLGRHPVTLNIWRGPYYVGVTRTYTFVK